MQDRRDIVKDKFTTEVCLIVISENDDKEKAVGLLTDVSENLRIPSKSISKDCGILCTLKQIREDNFLPHSFESYELMSTMASIIDTEDIYAGKEKDEIGIIFIDYLKHKNNNPRLKWLSAEEIFEMNDIGKIEPKTWHSLKKAVFPQ